MKKIVLAYSGGLDTSVILKWLQNTYKCSVVTFTADIGQGEELSPVERKAKNLEQKIRQAENSGKTGKDLVNMVEGLMSNLADLME